MVDHIEEKIVFAVSAQTKGEVPLVVLGIPAGAWVYMKDGKTHTFDLTRVGLPVRLMVFGADTHDAAMKVLTNAAAARNEAVLDLRREDFAIKVKDGA